MKHEYFGDHKLYCVQMMVRFMREGSETHVFEYIEYTQEVGDVAIGPNVHETSIHGTT